MQHFITLMDSIKLNLMAVDQLHPLLSDLMACLNRMQAALPTAFQGRDRIREWLIVLNRMKASDELSETQVRQLLFDLENAHGEFYRSLGGNK